MRTGIAILLTLLIGAPLAAQPQTAPGSGNEDAVKIARRSPMVRSAIEFLEKQARALSDPTLRSETLDAIANPSTCIQHRAGLTDAAQNAILETLTKEGLLDITRDKTFPGGLKAGVFPPVLQDGTSCPRLPQPFLSAPGSAFHGHHSYPGGLPIHEWNNALAGMNLAEEYRTVYGSSKEAGAGAIDIDQDIIVGAPIWHDWAKSIVFQWNGDGSEFQELNFGGNGRTDNRGAEGDSLTGSHHILAIAETMKRGLNPAFVIAQASAHSAPTLGAEYKVVNWIRTAAILAGIDPVARGFLTPDRQGALRLPALRNLGEIDFLETTPPQTNILVEYLLHNLSDADFSFSGPAVTMVETVLLQLAPEFGVDPADVASYNVHYRNPILSALTAERLQIIYASLGLGGVRRQLQLLRTSAGVF